MACSDSDLVAAIGGLIPGRRFKNRQLPYKGVVLFKTTLDATSLSPVSLKGGDTCVSQTPRDMSLFTSASQRLVVAIGGMRITVNGLQGLADAQRFQALHDLYLRWKGPTGPNTAYEYLQGPRWWGGEPDSVMAMASDSTATAVTNRTSRGMTKPQRMPGGRWLVDWFQDDFEVGTKTVITGASALTVLIEALMVVGPGDVSSVCRDVYKPTKESIDEARQVQQGTLLTMLDEQGGGFFVGGDIVDPAFVGPVIGAGPGGGR